ncbi:MAG: purine-nucleoside phosphorylase [Deltaproteobacteria bacterium]|nr:purine-nucleoside phosphorylase [Deltaproteobacteria bacterium]
MSTPPTTTATTTYEQVQEAASAIREAMAPRAPAIGVVLGSGLGPFADELEDAVAIPYEEIPGFAVSTVAGHAGRLVVGSFEGITVATLQGRVHAYEGLPLDQIVLPIRALVAAGCKKLVLTNAAGGIRDDLTPGDLVLMRDHINFQGRNPLVGPNDDRLGPRFPDMSNAYDAELRKLVLAAARDLDLPLTEGVYAALLGPSYETPAEIRMLRTVGADLAGMSTVPEVIAAHQMGAKIVGISCVTNFAAGLGVAALSHEEVKETAERVRVRFTLLLGRVITVLASLARSK